MSTQVAAVLVGSIAAAVGALGATATAGVETLMASPIVQASDPYSTGGPAVRGDPVFGPGGTAPIPHAMITLYRRAAANSCHGLAWTVLAAIGTVESGNGTSELPGVHTGANSAGAEGPMQFEPATFIEYDQPVPPGGANPPNPYDATDAVFAAARMLCANGATTPGGLPGAIFAYNHASWYVSEVLDISSLYANSGVQSGIPKSRGGR